MKWKEKNSFRVNFFSTEFSLPLYMYYILFIFYLLNYDIENGTRNNTERSEPVYLSELSADT